MASYVGDLGGNTLPPDVLGGNAVDALVGQRITTGAENVTVLVIAQPTAAIEEITSLAERATDHLTRLKPDDAVMVLEQHGMPPTFVPPEYPLSWVTSVSHRAGGTLSTLTKAKAPFNLSGGRAVGTSGYAPYDPSPQFRDPDQARLSQRVDFLQRPRKIFDRAISRFPRLRGNTTRVVFPSDRTLSFSRRRTSRARARDATADLYPVDAIIITTKSTPQTRSPRGSRHRPAVDFSRRGREGQARGRFAHRGGAEAPQAKAEGFRVRPYGARRARRRAARVRQREARHVAARDELVQLSGAEVAARVRAFQAGHRREVHGAEGDGGDRRKPAGPVPGDVGVEGRLARGGEGVPALQDLHPARRVRSRRSITRNLERDCGRVACVFQKTT